MPEHDAQYGRKQDHPNGGWCFLPYFFVPAVHQPQQHKHRNGPAIRCKAARRAGRIAAQRGKAHRDRRGQDHGHHTGAHPVQHCLYPGVPEHAAQHRRHQQDDDKEEPNAVLAKVTKDSVLSLSELLPEQHFTQPPAHFTEASLVKTLEELGIGRPSTYAPTISTLISRRYVAKEQKNLYLSDLGDIVNQIMVSAFPSIVDVNFTATMEALLDGVAEGNVEWKTIVRNFYPDLEKAVSHAEKALEKIKIEDEVTDVVCELCGRNMVIKYGPHGKFLACPGFPECRNTKPYYEKIGVKCPKCGGEIVIKKTQKGRRYYGCENNPECDVMTWQKPSNERCPKCGGMMLEKGSKLVCADNTCGYIEKKEK